MRGLSRVRALLGIASAQLRHERAQTLLAVIGVALAVLAAVLLASVGIGVVETGQQKFDQSGRDLWVSGGPIELRPGAVGGFQNSIVGAHELRESLRAREDVRAANIFIFQTLYASPDGEEFDTIVGVGAATAGPSVNYQAGGPIRTEPSHYANGTYDGPMTHEVVISPRMAEQYNLSLGDSISLGGTLVTARNNNFTVVGISRTYSQFVGSSTAVLEPSELQEITGTTLSDRASMLSIIVSNGTDPTAVAEELEQAYPGYTFRTNREQLLSTLREQAVVLASGASLGLLALLAGLLLLMNLQLSFVYRHRETLSALTAIGLPRFSLIVVVSTYTLFIGVIGGLLGIGAAIPGIWAINQVVATVTGFENVAVVSRPLLAGGLVIAFGVSFIAGIVTSLYLVRIRPLKYLQR